AAAALVVAEDVTDPGATGTDAERDEADTEDQRQEHEHPLRVTPQAREEHGVLDRGSTAAATRGRAYAPSIRLRALRAALVDACLFLPLSLVPSPPAGRVGRALAGAPPRTAVVTGSSHGRNGESARERTAMSARLPGVIDPISASSPSTRAPPSVTSSSASD